MEPKTFLATIDNCNSQEVTELINNVYEVDEEPVWIKGHYRTNLKQIQQFIVDGEIIVAVVNGEVIGAIHTKLIDEETGWFGMLGVKEEFRGSGIASQLYEDSENLMQEKGCNRMQCEILIPEQPVIPSKPQLQSWYGRLGFNLDHSVPMEKMYPHAVQDLKMPCVLEVYSKSLV